MATVFPTGRITNGLGDITQPYKSFFKEVKDYLDANPASVTNFGDLNDVSITSVADNQIPQYNSTSGKWENVTNNIALINGLQTALDGKQPLDTGLTSIAGLATAADKMIYTTASDTYATTDLTSFGRSLINDADASTARTTLGLGSLATLSDLSTFDTGDLVEGSNLYYTGERVDDRVAYLIRDGGGVTWTYTDGAASLTPDVDHDSTTNFVANKHIDHTSVTLTAGEGISGGGDISANRSFALDLNQLTTDTSIATGDKIAFTDITDNGNKNITFANFEAAIDHGNLLGLSDDDHTQYALLAGRGGGQTLIGGNAADEDLHLQTTSHASKGSYFLDELTSNGFIKTQGSNGELTIDTNTYITGNQTITLSGNVTGSGTTAITTTIADGAVTYAKMQDVSANDKILGRSTAGAGDIEEITCTSFARSILDDADAATVRATIGVGTSSSPEFSAVTISGGGTLELTESSGDSTIGYVQLVNGYARVNTTAIGYGDVIILNRLHVSANAGICSAVCKGNGEYFDIESANPSDDSTFNWAIIKNASPDPALLLDDGGYLLLDDGGKLVISP